MKRILSFLAVAASAGLVPAAASAQTLNYSNPFTVTTLAGYQYSSGSSDGTGTDANFNGPVGVVADSSGALYVADSNNYTIRKVTAQGVVSTFAGTAGKLGNLDGAQPTFGPIGAIAIDSSGTLYVADWTASGGPNATIRKVTSAGVASTFVPGSAGLNQPNALAVDASGNLYIADSGNNVIRKVTPSGTVSIFAGVQGQNNNVDGPLASAQFGYVTGLAFDPSGNLYAVDHQWSVVRKITSTTVATYAGQAGGPGLVDGSLGASAFIHPWGITSDSAGNLFVTDDNGLIREISASGTVSTIAGSTELNGNIDASGSFASFNNPTGLIAVSSGVLYICNTASNTVRKATAVGGTAPSITNQPKDELGLAAGGTATFGVFAAGQNLTYQWKKNGSTNLTDGGNISGSQTATLTIGSVSSADAGNYLVVVTNGAGSATSNSAQLTLAGSGAMMPVITTQPTAVTAVLGGTANFSVGSSGTVVGYQWALNNVALKDGSRISGSNSSALTITGVTAGDAGNYTVTLTNSAGAVVSNAAALTVQAAQTVKAHLVNLSTLAQTSPTSALAVGFAVGGSGTKNLLIRGIGPALANFSIATPLPNPLLGLYVSGNLIDSNQGWGNASNPSQLATIMTQVGAFSLPSGSADSALFESVSIGSSAYVASAQVTGAANTPQTGNALAEIYDADTAANPSARLINLSSKAEVGATTPLSAGFVISGSGTETVLIRGIGPALAAFSIADALPQPSLTVVNANASTPALNQTNQGWNFSLSSVFSQVGAFGLTAGSADCALELTLPAGNYTATVSGANGSIGTALVEVYEVSSQ